MKEKLANLMSATHKEFGKKVDAMIVVTNGDRCGNVVYGEVDEIASAIYSTLKNPASETSAKIYLILKTIVLNVISEPDLSYASDLLNSVMMLAADMYLQKADGPQAPNNELLQAFKNFQLPTNEGKAEEENVVYGIEDEAEDDIEDDDECFDDEDEDEEEYEELEDEDDE